MYPVLRSLNLILYMLLLGSVFLIVKKPMMGLLENIMITVRIRRMKKGKPKNVRMQLNQHLHLMVKALFNAKEPQKAVFLLEGMSVLLALLTYIFLNNSPLLYQLLFSLVMLLLPYLLLRVRLQQLRLNSSYEGDVLITELLSQYKLNYYNLEVAMERTALHLADDKKTKRPLLILVRGIKNHQASSELKQYLQEFQYTIDTNWGKNLTAIIEEGVETGINIQPALQNLLGNVERAAKVREYEKRENIDAGAVIKYLIPIGYVFTMWYVARGFGMSFANYVQYQFVDPSGKQMFLTMVLSYIGSFCLYLYFHKHRMDF